MLAYGFMNAAYYCLVTLATFSFNFKSDLLRVPPSLAATQKISLAAVKLGKIAGWLTAPHSIPLFLCLVIDWYMYCRIAALFRPRLGGQSGHQSG